MSNVIRLRVAAPVKNNKTKTQIDQGLGTIFTKILYEEHTAILKA
jgi:hypothetical protein